jgi:hypothetical protein
VIGFGFFAVDTLLLPVLTRGASANVSLGFQLGLLAAHLRLPALASRWTDAAQPAVVVSLWLLALLALSRRLVRRRDVLE